MLRLRLITGTGLIALLVAVVWLDAMPFSSPFTEAAWSNAVGEGGVPPRGLVLVGFTILVVATLLGREIGVLLQGCGGRTPSWIVAIGTALVAAATLLASLVPAGPGAALLTPLAIVATVVCSLAATLRPERLESAIASAAGVALGTAYAGTCLGGWMILRQEHAAWILGGAVLTAKSCDIGAYFTGLSIGRRKLVPWLSPKKTWEGLLGGLCTSTLVGWGLATWSHSLADPADHVAPLLGAVLGGLLGAMGQAGDLAESLLKRVAGAKDSGGTLPGLGGIFDVMDSLLPAGLLLPLVLSR
ncbi:MAG: phosphatidate cytidylyltransferase [Phycisphaerales bacterium]